MMRTAVAPTQFRKTVLVLASVATAMLLAIGFALLGVAGPAGAELSPRNGKILFTSVNPSGGSNSLETIDPDGSGRSPFTTLPVHLGTNPAWSPDGTKAAFIDSVDGVSINGPFSIVIMNADGTERTVVPNIASSSIPQHPTWSPDGATLAFGLDYSFEVIDPVTGFPVLRFSSDIYTINVDGTEKTNLRGDVPVEEEAYREPDWSPDSTKLVFGQDHLSSPPEIYTVSADGSGEPTGFPNPVLGQQPVWSPDGSKIAFVGPDQDIYVMNADGTGQQKVTTDGGTVSGSVRENNPEWSPDGTKLVFNGTLRTCSPFNPRICFDSRNDIFTINIDGSNRTNLTNTTDRTEIMPSWQPVFDTTPPEVLSTDPSNLATGVAATDNISATFIEEGSGIDTDTINPDTFKVEQVKPTGNVQVQADDVTYDADSQTATFDPSKDLAKGLYRATLTGVADNAGNVMPDYTWIFATAGPPKR